MSDAVRDAVADTLDYLMALGREGVRPREAEARLRVLQTRYPDSGMRLVWEVEAYDESVHYDVLLRAPQGATVSLSVCPDRALPWPLRGVHRWSEADLVRVNGTVLKVQEAIACLDFIWSEAPIVNRLLDACLLQEELRKDPMHLSDADLQLGMDGFRRAHKLYNTEDAHHWMQARGMTHDQLERLVADNLVIARLRERITEDRVEDYFADHRSHLDTAVIAQIDCADEEVARKVHRMVLTGELDFYAAAQDQYLAAARQRGEQGRSLFATVRRRDLSDELAASIFAAAPGDVVGPTCMPDGYAVTRVLSLTLARLDEPTRATIKRVLFDAWLAERRRAATIAWSWGSSERAE